MPDADFIVEYQKALGEKDVCIAELERFLEAAKENSAKCDADRKATWLSMGRLYKVLDDAGIRILFIKELLQGNQPYSIKINEACEMIDEAYNVIDFALRQVSQEIINGSCS